jgi:hypothetical protein
MAALLRMLALNGHLTGSTAAFHMAGEDEPVAFPRRNFHETYPLSLSTTPAGNKRPASRPHS